ncbi:hypothetical protein MMC10_010467 [Thelotrema lepadinum]|nr:hypothetical protein [Thelotrema lepadinum]
MPLVSIFTLIQVSPGDLVFDSRSFNHSQKDQARDEKSSCDVPDSATGSVKPFRFLDLPLELQHQVFRYCLKKRDYHTEIDSIMDGEIVFPKNNRESRNITFEPLFGFPKALLLVNSRVTSAAKEVFYRENEWLLGCRQMNHYDFCNYIHIVRSSMGLDIRRAHHMVHGLEWPKLDIEYHTILHPAILQTAKKACVLLSKFSELKKLTVYLKFWDAIQQWSEIAESLQPLSLLPKECQVVVIYWGNEERVISPDDIKSKMQVLLDRDIVLQDHSEEPFFERRIITKSTV